MDYKYVADQVQEWIAEKCERFSGGVIGISGGIDSAVAGTLAVRALGKNSVFALSMPNVSKKDCADQYTAAVFNHLDINYTIIPIEDVVIKLKQLDSFLPHNIVDGNTMARIRMILLYRHANSCNRLVIGTTNKTEAAIGYYTKWGDGAVDIEPIADLYKTEVWELAKYLGIPQIVIDRAPSAELWAEQTDEIEIGCTYKEIDAYLKNGEANDRVCEIINSLKAMSAHKRVMPDFCHLL